jgi:hypothetical protein
LYGPPKYTQIGIFGLKRKHLATLPGTNVIIFLIRRKKLALILAFVAQTTAKFLQKIDHDIGL